MSRHSLLSPLVGLDCRLGVEPLGGLPKFIGTPSRIPPSSKERELLTASRLGSGKLESGPAILWSTSKEDLFCIFRVLDVGGEEDNSDGPKGRGDDNNISSRRDSWACWCLILCFSVDI